MAGWKKIKLFLLKFHFNQKCVVSDALFVITIHKILLCDLFLIIATEFSIFNECILNRRF